jgi:hypothetical protein
LHSLPHLSSTSTINTSTPYTFFLPSFLPSSISLHYVTSGKYCYDITDQNKLSTSHVYCGSCQSTLEGRLCGTRKCMSFTVPQICR